MQTLRTALAWARGRISAALVVVLAGVAVWLPVSLVAAESGTGSDAPRALLGPTLNNADPAELIAMSNRALTALNDQAVIQRESDQFAAQSAVETAAIVETEFEVASAEASALALIAVNRHAVAAELARQLATGDATVDDYLDAQNEADGAAASAVDATETLAIAALDLSRATGLAVGAIGRASRSSEVAAEAEQALEECGSTSTDETADGAEAGDASTTSSTTTPPEDEDADEQAESNECKSSRSFDESYGPESISTRCGIGGEGPSNLPVGFVFASLDPASTGLLGMFAACGSGGGGPASDEELVASLSEIPGIEASFIEGAGRGKVVTIVLPVEKLGELREAISEVPITTLDPREDAFGGVSVVGWVEDNTELAARRVTLDGFKELTVESGIVFEAEQLLTMPPVVLRGLDADQVGIVGLDDLAAASPGAVAQLSTEAVGAVLVEAENPLEIDDSGVGYLLPSPIRAAFGLPEIDPVTFVPAGSVTISQISDPRDVGGSGGLGSSAISDVLDRGRLIDSGSAVTWERGTIVVDAHPGVVDPVAVVVDAITNTPGLIEFTGAIGFEAAVALPPIGVATLPGDLLLPSGFSGPDNNLIANIGGGS